MAKRRANRRGTITVTAHGVEDAIKAITDLTKDLGGAALQEAVEAGAEIVRDRASQLAPRSKGAGKHPKGGHAADRLLVVASGKPGEAAAKIGPDAGGWYLQFAETGTTKHPARPFLRPALDETRDETRQAMIDALKRKR